MLFVDGGNDRVGIGGTPGVLFDIQGGSGGDEVLRFGGSGTTDNRALGLDLSGGSYELSIGYPSHGTGRFAIGTWDRTTFSEKFCIDTSSGNVGIGMGNNGVPAYLLDVAGTVDVNNLLINTAQGTDGQVLTSTGSGVGWEDAAGGGADFDTAITINDSGADVDFRIESDDDANMFFVDASTDRIGIGTASPESQLHLSSGDRQDDADGQLKIVQTATGNDATSNASLCVMNSTGTSQFMQWELNGLRIGSRLANGSGVGHVVFSAGQDVEAMRITEQYRVGIGTSTPATLLDVDGAVTKNSGSFRIDHPIPAMEDTHSLVHSFIEGPRADLIYRGVVDLVDGSATVNIDTAAGMTDGTFVLLCDDVQCFTTNEDNWDLVKASVSGNILTIESQNVSSTATISWMVIGDRKDQHMFDTSWTDENGKVIVEPERITGE